MLSGRASSKGTSTLGNFERKSASMLWLCTVYVHLSRRNVMLVGSPCQRYEALHGGTRFRRRNDTNETGQAHTEVMWTADRSGCLQ